MSSRETRKSVLRTLRLDKDLDELLQKDARTIRTNVNSFTTSILEKYRKWDRFAEKFGFISLTDDTFRSILETADEEKLANVAQELGARVPKDVMVFWFGRIDLESFLSYISLLSQYGGFGEVEIKKEDKSAKYTVTIHHSLGRRWSVYLEHFLREAARSAIHTAPQFEVGTNSLIFELP